MAAKTKRKNAKTASAATKATTTQATVASKEPVKVETLVTTPEEKKVETTKVVTDTIQTTKVEPKAEVKVEAKADPKEEVKADPKEEVKAEEKKVAVLAKKKASAKKVEEYIEEVYFQYAGHEILSNAIVDRIKEEYKNEGHRISSIKSLRVYIKPEDGRVYYVINGKDEQRSIGI